MRFLPIAATVVLLGCQPPRATTASNGILAAERGSFAEARFGVEFSHNPTWVREIVCKDTLADCTIHLRPPEALAFYEASSYGEREIAISWYSTLLPPEHLDRCSGPLQGSPLTGVVYSTSEPLNRHQALGLGRGAEACLSDGHSRSVLISMAPPTSTTDPDLLIIVNSFRFTPLP